MTVLWAANNVCGSSIFGSVEPQNRESDKSRLPAEQEQAQYARSQTTVFWAHQKQMAGAAAEPSKRRNDRCLRRSMGNRLGGCRTPAQALLRRWSGYGNVARP